MDLVLAVLAGALGALGMLRILEWALEKVGRLETSSELVEGRRVDKLGRPKTWSEFIHTRRGCIQVAAITLIGAVAGGYAERREAQRQESRAKLEDLDVKFLQFKGLTESVMSIANEEGISAGLNDSLSSYLAKYTAEIDELIAAADSCLPPDKLEEVNRLWNGIGQDVEIIRTMGVASGQSATLCVEVLQSTGDIRAIIREEYKKYD